MVWHHVLTFNFLQQAPEQHQLQQRQRKQDLIALSIAYVFCDAPLPLLVCGGCLTPRSVG